MFFGERFMKKEFNDKLVDLSAEIGVNVSDESLEKLYSYMNLMLEWNEKINLTVIRGTKEFNLEVTLKQNRYN